jgi:beta-lactamase superfamily II metal-dependent hydrolase
VSNFYEIDFLDVESTKSGDAISIRYQVDGVQRIHVVDGGYQATGERLKHHIDKYYSHPTQIDAVVVTHPDGDHAGGLRTILEEYDVSQLWMLRPWLYVSEIIDRFARYTSEENLAKRLKDIYPNLAKLEEIALERNIQIKEPFQGEIIDKFTVLAPTKSRYLDLIIESEKTPESAADSKIEDKALGLLESWATKTINFIKAAWGEEVFSDENTSAENEMSIVQYANLNEHKILLTGDAGRSALNESYEYAVEIMGLDLPGIDKFQVPHHGSRRNLSSELCDKWLGKHLQDKAITKFSAIVSAAKKDKDHPRNVVVRAMMHRGGKVVSTENGGLCTSKNAPEREGWSAVKPLDYPEEMEKN